MIREKAILDFKITAPSVWLAEKLGKSQAWVSCIKKSKGNPRLSVTTKEEIRKLEKEWLSMKVGSTETPIVYKLARSFNKLSKDGKWQFLNEIKE